jgi:NitT/TauT family transport system ATP-binding protein
MNRPNDAPILEADQISKIFHEADGRSMVALSKVSLTVRAGEFVALVGPSGCGKSTLLRIVAGLESHNGGTISVIGREVSGPGSDRGMVFQEYALLPWKNILENVAFGPQLKGVAKRERHAIAQQYIDLVGLHGFESKHPHQLSGGMRQRVAVARSLANKPAILLMDEPFAAIDAITRERLQEELIGICRAEQMTVLFVTHSVDEAVFLADRVIVLSGRPGEVVADVRIDLGRSRRWDALRNCTVFDQARDAVQSFLGQSTGALTRAGHL